MVKVTYTSWQEIVIHETIEHSVKDLVRLRVLGLREGSMAGPLLWAEGIVLSRNSMPPTDDVIRDQLKGILHFSAVEWAVMPKYKSVLRSEGVTVPVINVSNNNSLREVARTLKETFKEKAKRKS